MWGDVFPMCGDLCGGSYGDVWGGCLADTGPVRQAMKCWFTWQGYVFIRQLGGRPPSRKRPVDQPLERSRACRFLEGFARIWVAQQGDDSSGFVSAWLNQVQLCCPIYSRPASIDVEFAVDALGMGADRAQGDHEFTGDLGSRKVGFE